MKSGGPLARIAPLMLILFLPTLTSCCTVVGYSLGAAVDENLLRAPATSQELIPGRTVRLELADGRKLSGHVVDSGDSPQPWVKLSRYRYSVLPGSSSAPDTSRIDVARISKATRARVIYRPVLAGVGAALDVTLAYVLSGLPGDW